MSLAKAAVIIVLIAGAAIMYHRHVSSGSLGNDFPPRSFSNPPTADELCTPAGNFMGMTATMLYMGKPITGSCRLHSIAKLDDSAVQNWKTADKHRITECIKAAMTVYNMGKQLGYDILDQPLNFEDLMSRVKKYDSGKTLKETSSPTESQVEAEFQDIRAVYDTNVTIGVIGRTEKKVDGCAVVTGRRIYNCSSGFYHCRRN